MSFALRTWLFAITILILAEDFQYMLRVESSSFERIESRQDNSCGDCGEKDNESKGEKEEESKKEKKEEDQNKYKDSEQLSQNYLRLAKNIFHDALFLLSLTARELESPPPERF